MPDIVRPMLNRTTYSLLSRLGLPLILAGFTLRSLRQTAYRQRLGERLGLLSAKNLKKGGFVIHASSVGEVIALKPFILKVIEEFHGKPITVTTFTPTGSEQVKSSFGDKVQHCFLPIDNPGCVARFLDQLQPKAIVLMETEIWPNLLEQAHARNIFTLLINGRISPRSFPKYQKIHALVSNALNKIDQILTQSNEDAERFIALGANAKNTEVMGNLKYDVSATPELLEKAQNIRSSLGARPIWIIGSTHENEEALYLSAIRKVRAQHPELLVVIAPRHIERVQPVAHELTVHQLQFVCRKENKLPEKNHEVWLIDTLGELMLFYALADVTTVAGTFDETGGHNPLEPAALKKAITCGPNMKNFKEVTEKLLLNKGMLQVETIDELVTVVNDLLGKREIEISAEQLGENAFKVVKENQGATAKAIDALRAFNKK